MMISSDGRNRNTSGESIQSASQMSLSDDIVDRVRRALLLLNQAACYAADVQADSWNFAVPIAELTDIGLAANDIRWLVTKGYLEHRNEVREPDNGSREFVETGQFLLDKRTTFTITNSGRAFLAACNNETGALPVVEGQELNGSSGLLATLRNVNTPLMPRWESLKRELKVGTVIVKAFRVPAEIQELVLATFEEDGWPYRIDDPLPPVQRIDSKYRLKATIRSLNRNRRRPLIHFFGDGTGEAICWESTGCDEQGFGS